ncbi:MAG: porin family protein [Myxococcota bacterium]|nr:porin family protein [Myxococcota bacterium]
MSGTAFAQEPDGDPPEDGATLEADGTATVDPAPAPEPMMEPTAGPGKVIGVDAAFVLPLSDYGDAADFAVGALGRFEFGINNMLSVTARAGLLYHIGTPEGFSLMFIPIYAGVKYNIGTSGLFAFGEAGLTYIRASVEIGGMSASDSETKLGVNVGAGYQAGKIQARVGLLLPDVGEAADAHGIMASVGFDIAAL